MTAFSSHLDPARPADSSADTPPAPQHHDLFVQPHYTIELPPLDEDESFSPPPPPPAQRRRGAPRTR
ncbi:hypothetical protein [Streptomyces sp. NPDC050704]|uniref:hypothetical protein n=1 Tax=Streptomyces sp. NPDC050704 TaxID=3157219 RepID=UPI0034430C0F